MVTYGTLEVDAGGATGGTNASLRADSARILVSMATNFLATLCIGIKAWYGDMEAIVFQVDIIQAIP